MLGNTLKCSDKYLEKQSDLGLLLGQGKFVLNYTASIENIVVMRGKRNSPDFVITVSKCHPKRFHTGDECLT